MENFEVEFPLDHKKMIPGTKFKLNSEMPASALT